ncbi:MAG: class 3 adenylate cyclase [Candidatus Binatia bacterium]
MTWVQKVFVVENGRSGVEALGANRPASTVGSETRTRPRRSIRDVNYVIGRWFCRGRAFEVPIRGVEYSPTAFPETLAEAAFSQHDRRMPRLQRKNLSTPDEVRAFPNGRMDLVRLDELAVGYFVFEPGWRWSRDVGPIVGTTTCHHRHIGYAIEGSLVVRMDDGTEMTIGPGDAYEIPPGHDAWVVGEETVRWVEFNSAHEYGRAETEIGEHVLATLVFSDIVGSTATLSRIGDQAWADLVRRHNENIRSVIDRHRGRELATLGDGFLASFDGAARAVQAAAAMDPAVAELGLRVRTGVNTGDIVLDGGQARGIAVHTAARIADLAEAGEVLLSGTTCGLLVDSAFVFRNRGDYELKGLNGPRALFSLQR